jgi:hypothetical protein
MFCYNPYKKTPRNAVMYAVPTRGRTLQRGK